MDGLSGVPAPAPDHRGGRRHPPVRRPDQPHAVRPRPDPDVRCSGWPARLGATIRDAGPGPGCVDADAARLAADAAARRPFLTTGRQSLADFLPWADRAVLARVVDPPDFALPPAWTLITLPRPVRHRGRAPADADHAVDVLITKDSGGDGHEAKLAAAAALGIPVVIVARPPAGSAPAVTNVADVLPWLASVELAATSGRSCGVVAARSTTPAVHSRDPG